MKKKLMKVSDVMTSKGQVWDEKKMIKAEIRHRQFLGNEKTVKQLRKEIEQDEGWWQLKYQESLK